MTFDEDDRSQFLAHRNGLPAREAWLREGLTRDEMAAQISWDDGTVVVSGEYNNHHVSLRSWISSPQARPSTAPTDPSPPKRYVWHEQTHWGHRAGAVTDTFAVRRQLTPQKLEKACLMVLSDILCGADAQAAIQNRIANWKPNYGVAVVDFPADESDRRGTLLLAVNNGGPNPSINLRVVGWCRGYLNDHEYDVAATAATQQTAVWLDELPALARIVTENVIQGAPAPYAFPREIAGVRGPSPDTFREVFREIQLDGLERFAAGQIAECVDARRAALSDLEWAQSGPTVWPGVGGLHAQLEEATERENVLLEELERVGQLDPGREWIFDRDFPFETVRYDLLIH